MTEPTTQTMASLRENTQTVIEVDSRVTDNDSAYGKEFSTYTASLTSSVIDYRQENGRRYHGYRDGSYLLPNDQSEQERLDIAHELTLNIMDRKLFYAPIGPTPQRVIDIATGTGIWAIDFADQFPSAEVIGNDLSPVQPKMVPPNVQFVVDDIESDWAYDHNPFDFIHARYLASSIRDFPKLLEQCFNNVKPGGWVEFHDWDMQVRSEDGSAESSGIGVYYQHLIPAFDKAGYTCSPGPQLHQWFKKAGFVNIKVHKYRVPIGNWPKDPHYKKLGIWFLLQADPQGFEGAALAVLTRLGNWKPEEVKVLAAKAYSAATNPEVHGLFDFYVVYGQRP